MTDMTGAPLSKSAGHIFVLVAPSGAGKRTVIHKLLGQTPGLRQLKTYTTRAPRQEERGRMSEYNFLTRTDFESKIESGEILEYNQYSGHYYGTSRSAIEAALERGEAVILQIDVHGARVLKSTFPNDVTTLFLVTSLTELEQRLRERGANTEAEITERLTIARRELEQKDEFDFQVENPRGKLEQCVMEIASIIADRLGARA